MRLPCRMCSDPNDERTFKHMQEYVPSKAPHRCSTADEFGEVWMECIAFGADLTCWRCRHELGHEDSEYQCQRYIDEQLVFCDDCCAIKLASDFSRDMQEQWKLASQSTHISCKICTGEQAAKGRHAVDKTVLYACAGAGCSSEERQMRWPESHFIPEELSSPYRRLAQPKGLTVTSKISVRPGARFRVGRET